jgi:hypothetical protein
MVDVVVEKSEGTAREAEGSFVVFFSAKKRASGMFEWHAANLLMLCCNFK